MKKGILNLFLATGIAMGAVSCKDEKANKVEPTDAQDAAPATAEAVSYEVDTTSSVIEWRGTKPTGEHIGNIYIQSGNLTATEDGMVESGKVTIDMTSIEVTDEGIEDEDRENLENHLKGTVEGKETDFFNVNKFPTASFEITGTSEKDGKTYLQGNLTIKDTSKNIEIPVNTDINNDGEELSMESETFVLDRTDWNVNYGSRSVFDNLGDNFISDEMELKIIVKANKA